MFEIHFNSITVFTWARHLVVPWASWIHYIHCIFEVNFNSFTVFTRARYLAVSWASWIHSTHTHRIFDIHFNIIHPSIPTSLDFSLTLSFPTKIFHYFSSPAACPAHLNLIDLIINTIWWRMQIIKLFIMYIFPSSLYLLPFSSSAPCSQTPSIHVLFHQVSLP